MKSITIDGLTIGEGIPKVCVPIVGVSKDEIIEQTRNACASESDLVELRIDYYDGCRNVNLVSELLECLTEYMTKPCIFTLRGKEEGGELAVTNQEYMDILSVAMKNDIIQFVDVELSRERDTFVKIIQKAHEHNKKVIVSSHDFTRTPKKEVLLEKLEQMESLGADIAKIAVMPKDLNDVLILLDTTVLAKENLQIPIITMSMGKLGAISRAAGQIFGSCVTFGIAGKASAPGQIPATALKKMMEEINKYCV